jgi:hypothetical protein
MARVAVALLAVLGLLLAAAGLIAALAWGVPALGLNRNGRNPLDETLRGLAFAVTLYAVGAALLASTTRWLRTHNGPFNIGAFAFAGAMIPVLGVWMALRGYWTNIPMLLIVVVGIYAPIALGARPWGNRLSLRRSS